MRAIAPNFKLMLFPHMAGEPLPTTTWEKRGETLRVQWADQHDELVFTPGGKAYQIGVKRSKAAASLTRPATQ